MPATGILLALLSAIVWGTGDFVGGAAARRSNQFHVLALSAWSGVVVLAILALARETMPPASSLAWAGVAGLATAVGIASLYQGLALGGAAIVAPVAAVITATIPVLFAAFTIGLPDAFQLLGFVAALAGIWLVTRVPAGAPISRKSLQLALLAGGGFGLFLILISQIEGRLVFAPLAVARTVTLTVALVLMWLRRVPFPSPASNHLALAAGMLDAGGNVFFVLAEQHTRLDVAAVLSSLYPVATVALARIVWRERVTPSQWAGIVVCLIAVALMAE
jgi:drug/metabolite transporter (DMT)-like permease